MASSVFTGLENISPEGRGLLQVKIGATIYRSHNPYGENHRVSRLRENLTSGSEGEGLETNRKAPRQSFTRQNIFKMAKQHLRLVKEIQSRDFDALIAHTSIVFMRYMFLAYQCRYLTDHRSFGDLFHACCEEVHDITFMEALLRILSIATDRMRQMGIYCGKTFQAFYYAALDAAITGFGISRNSSIRFAANPEV